MIRMLVVAVAAAATLAGAGVVAAGVASADPSTYEVGGTWTLEQVKDQPRIVPRIEDDTIDVSCRGDDHVTDYEVSDSNLVSGSYKHTDGSGVSVQPKLTKTGQKLTITVTCKAS